MDDRLENLQLFCANLQILIGKGIPVQGGTQYQLIKGNDIVYITLYNNGNCYPRGSRTDLLILAQAWCNCNYTEGTLRPDFVASWREWNTNLQIVSDIQKQLGGVPDEEQATDEYKSNREVAFHDYMLSENRCNTISQNSAEFVIRNWIKRFCFMNISPNMVWDKILEYMQQNPPIGGLTDPYPFGYLVEALSVAFIGFCHTKYLTCSGGCPFCYGDMYDCIYELVDMLYMYSNNARVINYNKTNLDKLIKGKRSEISWTLISSGSPIEETMKQALHDSGILSMQQYQALAPTRRYRVDFMIPTPNGGMLAVECDGLQYHANTTTYISDRRRDNLFLQQGIIPVRFSSVDIIEDIQDCIKTIENIFHSYQIGQHVYHRKNKFGYFDTTE